MLPGVLDARPAWPPVRRAPEEFRHDRHPRFHTRALQLLPAAALFAGLVLGGPTFTENPSADLKPVGNNCPPKECVIINTGENEGNGNPISGSYAPTGSSSVIAVEG